MPRRDKNEELLEDYCPHCGQYAGGDSVCPNCGGKIFNDSGLDEHDEDEGDDGGAIDDEDEADF